MYDYKGTVMRILLLLFIFIGTLFSQTTIDFKEGWQLVGVPVALEDMSRFNNKNVEVVWGFDGETQSWRGYSPEPEIQQKMIQKDILPIDNLKPWQGIWVYSKSPWSLDVDVKDSVSEAKNSTILLYKGWNLISIAQNTVVSDSFFGDALVWKYSSDKGWMVNDENLSFPSIETIGMSEGLWVKSKIQRKIEVDEQLSSLDTFNSESSMLSYIRDMLKLNSYRYEYLDDVLLMPSSETSTQSDYSNDTTDATTTNLQEEGVDEGDILKHNSKYIFSADNSVKKIIVSSFDNLVSKDYKPIGEIDMQGRDIVAMYLQDNRLSVISNATYYYIYADTQIAKSSRIMPPYTNSNQQFNLDIFDVSDINSIKTLASYTIDGEYQDSRIVDGKLFLISQFYPNIEYKYLKIYDSNGSWKYDYDNPIVASENLIPKISHLDISTALIEPENLYAPKKLDQSADITTISSFELSNQKYSESISFIGNTHTYYASKNSLYLVSSEYPYYYDFSHFKEQQMIYKFSLSDKLKYAGSGFVDGVMLNSFSMSEKDNYLRVATTVGNSWSKEGTRNSLFVLKQEGDKLVIKSTLSGLGKEQERIKAVRFMGDRAYVVTFKQTDPLYTLDLSNPLEPKKAGELSIDGFSEYLHVIDDNRVLSIGRDADENGRQTALQISLFDISDFSNPVLADKIKIGSSSTYSQAEYNHKAFIYRSSDKIFAIAYSDYSAKYIESLGVYQLNGMKIDKLKKVSVTNKNRWGDVTRGLIFNSDESIYAAVFKGSNIMSEVVK